MGTTTDKLNKLLTTKSEIKQAIIDKGVSDVGDVFSAYPTYISKIETGGASNNIEYSMTYGENTTNVQNIGVSFKNDDGTCLYYFQWHNQNLKTFEFTKANLTKQPTTIQRMFTLCIRLTSVKGLDIFDLSKVTDAQNVFYGCNVLTDVVLPSLPSVTNVTQMFCQCSALTNVDISSMVNLQNVTQMFCQCSALTNVVLPTAKVTSISGMFYTCRYLGDCNFKVLDTSKVADFTDVFAGCWYSTSFDLSSWSTKSATNFKDIFLNNKNMSHLIFGSEWGTNTKSLVLDLSTVATDVSYTLDDDTYNSMLTMYDRASNGLDKMTIKFSSKHNIPDGFIDKMTARGYTITLV